MVAGAAGGWGVDWPMWKRAGWFIVAPYRYTYNYYTAFYSYTYIVFSGNVERGEYSTPGEGV
jgi:hypothetical protein